MSPAQWKTSTLLALGFAGTMLLMIVLMALGATRLEELGRPATEGDGTAAKALLSLQSATQAHLQRTTEQVLGATLGLAEQSEGIEQVNRAVSDMDRVTHENTTLVQQAAASASALALQAQALQQVVDEFKLEAVLEEAELPHWQERPALLAA